MAKNICSLSYPLTGKLVLSTKHAETRKACFHHTPFTGYDRQERDIAALFLLDMSGSTKGWIMEAEKEAFVAHGRGPRNARRPPCCVRFSGITRNKCDFCLVRSFEELYGDTVKRRISGILPKDYIRMGPPIRHATSLLGSVRARTKLLITLSDGRPEDYDAYKGIYGIEDTRKSLIEAKERGSILSA